MSLRSERKQHELLNSSDTFSFDNAATAENADGTGNSGNSSDMQSVSQSDSTKRSRPAIEDAERESRPIGRVKTSTHRSSRTPSASRPSKASAYKKIFRPHSSQGSRRERRGAISADEELEARLREVENDGDALRAEMRQIEDEHVAERTQYHVIVQSAREDWNEFNQQ